MRGGDCELLPDELTEEALEIQEMMLTMACARGWGLAIHGETPDARAIKRLLDVRFMHSSDDIKHEDVFGWGGAT